MIQTKIVIAILAVVVVLTAGVTTIVVKVTCNNDKATVQPAAQLEWLDECPPGMTNCLRREPVQNSPSKAF